MILNDGKDELFKSKHVTILVAEDNPINQEIAMFMLKDLGFQCNVVSNGLEALEAMEQSNYALVLMDIQMPEMDGLTASRIIRESESAKARILKQKRRIPIIAISANALESAEEEECIDDFLIKPYSKKELGRILDRWLSIDRETFSSSHKLAIHEQSETSKLEAVEAVLDFDTLQMLRVMGKCNDLDFLTFLFKKYKETGELLLDDMQVALTRESREGVRKAAHSLKSSSGSIGALELATLCEKLESESENVVLLLEMIHLEFRRVLKALSNECGDCIG